MSTPYGYSKEGWRKTPSASGGSGSRYGSSGQLLVSSVADQPYHEYDLLLYGLGSTYYARDWRDNLISSNSTFHTLWNSTITAGTTRKNKVIVKGNITNTGKCAGVSNVSVNADAASFTRSGTGFDMFDWDTKSNFDISGGMIFSSAKAVEAYDTNEVRLKNCSYFSIDNFTINGAAEDAIRVIGSSYGGDVTRNKLYNSNRHAILVAGTGPHHINVTNNFVDTVLIYDGITNYTTDGHSITYSNNTVQNVNGSAASSAGIQLEELGSTDANNISAIGNPIYNCKYGIGVASSMRPVSVIGNPIRKCERGIFLQNTLSSVIKGNNINNSEMTSTNYPIFIYGARRCSISSNPIWGASAYTKGIYWNQSGTYQGNTVSGNTFLGCLNGLENIGNNNTYNGNLFERTEQDGMVIATGDQYNKIHGNIFLNGSQQTDATYSDILVGGSAGNNMYGLDFVDNQSFSDATNRPDYFIKFNSAANTNNITLALNRVVGTRTGFRSGLPVSVFVERNNNYNGVLQPDIGGFGTVALSLDSTGGNATVPNADTDITTYSLGANNYSKIMIEGTIEVVTGVLSTVQDITFKAKIGASTKTYTVPATNVAGRRFAHVTMQATQTGAATMAISHGAAAADANTTDYVHNLYVWGIL